jgi:hypothetical protein
MPMNKTDVTHLEAKPATALKIRLQGIGIIFLAAILLGAVVIYSRNSQGESLKHSDHYLVLKYLFAMPVILGFYGIFRVIYGIPAISAHEKWSNLSNPILKYVLITPFLILITLTVIILLAISLPTSRI